MKAEPVIIEVLINASIPKVWRAITEKDQMNHWYFPMKEFKPVTGFTFKIVGERDGKQYPTSCTITEVIPARKLAHTWSFDEFPAKTMVVWELFPDGAKTRLRLTHEELENMPADRPEASRDNHWIGWTYIVGTSLKRHLEDQ